MFNDFQIILFVFENLPTRIQTTILGNLIIIKTIPTSLSIVNSKLLILQLKFTDLLVRDNETLNMQHMFKVNRDPTDDSYLEDI